MDDSNSRTLEPAEFKKAMKEYQLGLTDAEIDTLFKAFDINKDGNIVYDEFLRIIRVPLLCGCWDAKDIREK